MTINFKKTVLIIFRRGERIATEDRIQYNMKDLAIVNSLKYLGITLQSSGSSFSAHIRETAAAAIRNFYDIKDPTKLALHTAMTLFRAEIEPVLTYGIELFCNHLTISDLTAMEGVKARFLKRILGVFK